MNWWPNNQMIVFATCSKSALQGLFHLFSCVPDVNNPIDPTLPYQYYTPFPIPATLCRNNNSTIESRNNHFNLCLPLRVKGDQRIHTTPQIPCCIVKPPRYKYPVVLAFHLESPSSQPWRFCQVFSSLISPSLTSSPDSRMVFLNPLSASARDEWY